MGSRIVGIDKMDAFLRKHDVDVGKTFAVLMFLTMVEQLYKRFFALLFQHTFSLNIGILILYDPIRPRQRHVATSGGRS